MQYTRLGKTGLKVSRLCLGCMTYGDPTAGTHAWSLNEEQSRPFIQKALELGFNFFDTANVYSLGSSEEIVGRALRDFAKRDEVVIATKLYNKMREEPNGRGLSRKAVMTEIDNSLRRLRTDYVDLYQIHRWDEETPIEETLEALNDVVKSGKALYVGASSMAAWQFAKALFLADHHGYSRFVSMQNHYNLLYREEEREMLALCADQGIGVIPWSPLARGRLTRASGESTTARSQSDRFAGALYDRTEEADRTIIDAVGKIASERGVARASVGLAWLLHNPVVTAPIIGASKPGHLEDAVAALELKLSAEEIQLLEQAYVPHEVAGITIGGPGERPTAARPSPTSRP